MGDGYVYQALGELRKDRGENVWLVATGVAYENYLDTMGEGELEIEPDILYKLVCIEGPRIGERIWNWHPNRVGEHWGRVEEIGPYEVVPLVGWTICCGMESPTETHILEEWEEEGWIEIKVQIQGDIAFNTRRYMVGDLVDRGCTMRRSNEGL